MGLQDQIVRGLVLQGGGNVLGLATGLARAAVMARLASASEIGAYAIALVAVGMAVRVGGLGIASALYHYDGLSTRSYRQCLALATGASVLVGAGAGYIGDVALGTPMSWAFVVAVAASAGGQALAEVAGTHIGLRLAYGPLATAGVVARTLGDGLAIAALVVSPDLGGLLVGLGLQGVVLAVSFLLADYRVSRWRAGSDAGRLTDLRAILRLGTLTVFDGFVNFAVARLDRLIVSEVYGLSTLGYYELVATLAERPLQLVLTSVRGVFAPLITRYVRRASALRAVHRGYMQGVGLVMVPATVIALCFGESLLSALYGAAYGDYAGVYAALTVLAWAKSTGLPIWQHIVATGQIRLSVYANLAIGSLRLIVLYGAATIFPLGVAVWIYVGTRALAAGLFEQRMRHRHFRTPLTAAFGPLVPLLWRSLTASLGGLLVLVSLRYVLPESHTLGTCVALFTTGLLYVLLSYRELLRTYSALRLRSRFR